MDFRCLIRTHGVDRRPRPDDFERSGSEVPEIGSPDSAGSPRVKDALVHVLARLGTLIWTELHPHVSSLVAQAGQY